MATNELEREALTAELKTRLICRFCLIQGTDDLSNIYAKDTPVKSLLPLPVEIMAVASVEVFLNDGMPSSVCLKCRLTFDYCYRFKQMCKRAETLLNQVPLLGEWPAALIKPIIPPELLPKPITPIVENKSLVQQGESSPPASKELLQPQPQLQPSIKSIPNASPVQKISTSVSTPRKILNSNPAALPEPPMLSRLKKEKSDETFSFLTKVENNEEIYIDDVQRLMACEELEFTTHDVLLKEFTPTNPAAPTTSTANSTKIKQKVLNKSSIRILNKEANIEVEPRLKHPQLKKDEDGNVSIVTEILDPNEPYEAESDSIKNAAPVMTNVFPCPHCERTFPLLQLRDIHVVNHTRERHYPCPECDRSFFSKYDLQKHTVLHTGERKYKCSVCDRGFTRPALLHRHEKIHTDIPKYLCVFCEKTFLSKDDMEKHTERHSKNRPFKCKVCSKAFAFKQGLERHQVVHSIEQPYACQYCDKSFCTSSKLARHLVAHAGERPFPCKFCRKSYLLSHHLSRHMRTHKNGFVMYSCNECDEVYNTCNELVLHSVEHATATMTCPLCQQDFEDVASVTAHIKEHSHNELFPCEFCDLIFLTNDEQKCHVSSAHAADLAAYNKDEYKTEGEQEKANDGESEGAIEEFLYDEFTAEEYHITANESEVPSNSNQKNFQETVQMNIEDEQHSGEQYLKVEKLTIANAFDPEMFGHIIEDEEPIAKKSKIDDTNKVAKRVANQGAPSRRKSPRSIAENVGDQNPRKSHRGVNLSRNTANVGAQKLKQAQADQRNNGDGDTGASTSSKVLMALQTASKAVTPGKREQAVGTETGPTVTHKKVGEKKVKVQKIVVTKAEAAVMAKQGRLQIKDGNLILKSKSTK